MESSLCNKQYVGKAETVFNTRPAYHRENVKNPNPILACRHFQQLSLDFNKNQKCKVIED